MVSITQYDIESLPFAIRKISQGSFDLTTATVYTGNAPVEGGITIKPRFKIENVNDGRLFITQVCTSHSLKIEMPGHDVFELTLGVHKDTLYPTANHYSFYPIKNNLLMDEFGERQTDAVFWDAPHRELFNHWTKFKYEIQFQTWFQLYFNNSIQPISAFDWHLQAECINIVDGWKLLNQGYSTENDIRNSIRTFNENDRGLDTSGLPHLRTVVRDFFNSLPNQ